MTRRLLHVAHFSAFVLDVLSHGILFHLLAMLEFFLKDLNLETYRVNLPLVVVDFD
jgi:hypothetical protein